MMFVLIVNVCLGWFWIATTITDVLLKVVNLRWAVFMFPMKVLFVMMVISVQKMMFVRIVSVGVP